jgi:hypothetical protein
VVVVVTGTVVGVVVGDVAGVVVVVRPLVLPSSDDGSSSLVDVEVVVVEGVVEVVGGTITTFLAVAATEAAQATIVDADARATTRVPRVTVLARRRRRSRSSVAWRAALMTNKSRGRP